MNNYIIEEADGAYVVNGHSFPNKKDAEDYIWFIKNSMPSIDTKVDLVTEEVYSDLEINEQFKSQLVNSNFASSYFIKKIKVELKR